MMMKSKKKKMMMKKKKKKKTKFSYNIIRALKLNGWFPLYHASLSSSAPETKKAQPILNLSR
jgi:predicted nucleotide-binding protein (sugar kinase/HSP70/actin superfamily)